MNEESGQAVPSSGHQYHPSNCAAFCVRCSFPLGGQVFKGFVSLLCQLVLGKAAFALLSVLAADLFAALQMVPCCWDIFCASLTSFLQ